MKRIKVFQHHNYNLLNEDINDWIDEVGHERFIIHDYKQNTLLIPNRGEINITISILYTRNGQ